MYDRYEQLKVSINVPDKEVYIPGEDSVELANIIVSEYKNYPDYLSVLDMGTGSGLFGIAAKKWIKQAKVVVSDISEIALNTASQNTSLNDVQLNFSKSDLWDDLIGLTFDLVVAALPCYSSQECDQKEAECPEDEWWKIKPRTAYDAGINKNSILERLVYCSPRHMNKNAYLYMIVPSHEQIEHIKRWLDAYGYVDVSVLQYEGEDHYIKARYSGSLKEFGISTDDERLMQAHYYAWSLIHSLTKNEEIPKEIMPYLNQILAN